MPAKCKFIDKYKLLIKIPTIIEIEAFAISLMYYII